jgi:hypothetical protein
MPSYGSEFFAVMLMPVFYFKGITGGFIFAERYLYIPTLPRSRHTVPVFDAATERQVRRDRARYFVFGSNDRSKPD